MPLWEVLGCFRIWAFDSAFETPKRVPRRSQWSHSASRASRCWSMARTGHQVRPPAAQKQCAYDRYNSGMLHVTPCSTGIYYDSLWFYNILHVSTMKLWNHLWWIWLRCVHHDPAGVYGACGSHIFCPWAACKSADVDSNFRTGQMRQMRLGEHGSSNVRSRTTFFLLSFLSVELRPVVQREETRIIRIISKSNTLAIHESFDYMAYLWY
jgi:hypothetical protein